MESKLPGRPALLTYSPRTLLASRLLERALWLVSPLLRRRRPAARPASPTVLLVEPFQMGDVLSLSVMLDPLLARFPAARLVVWCHSRAADVFRSDPRVAEVLHAPFPWSGRGSKRGTRVAWAAVLHSVWQARRLRVDAAIDTRGDIRSQALLLLAGCRERIGFTTYVNSNLHLRGLLLTHPLPAPAAKHRLHMNLEALAPLLGGVPPLTLPAMHAAELVQDSPPLAGRVILLHRGAGWLYRRWGLPRWVELVTRLQQIPDARLLQIAGPGELEQAEELSAALPAPLETLSTSFDGLLQRLSEATVFIGLDSGPMNAAALLNVPVVALFGPGIASMWQPLSRGSVFLQHIEDYPCHPCTQITCVRPHDSCMTTITVDEVFAQAVRVLAECGSATAARPSAAF